MDPLPPVTPEALTHALQAEFQRLCSDVADAVSRAPTGHVIPQSEERVRDLLGDFRLKVFQAALQLRIDAAEAAFSPDGRGHRPPPGEQGA
jgi:hypothetical protein